MLEYKEKKKPGAQKAESGGGVLGERAASPSPPAKGAGGALKAPPVGSGQSPGKFEIWCNLRRQNSLQKCLNA